MGNKVEQILDPKPEEQLTKAEAIAEVVKQPARGSNRKPQKRGKSASNGIIVKGESNSGLLVRLAHCCNPVISATHLVRKRLENCYQTNTGQPRLLPATIRWPWPRWKLRAR